MAVKWKLKHRVTDILWQNSKQWQLISHTHIHTYNNIGTQLFHANVMNTHTCNMYSTQIHCHRCWFPHLSSRRCTRTQASNQKPIQSQCVEFNETVQMLRKSHAIFTQYAQPFTDGFGNCTCVSQNWWIRLTNTSTNELKIETRRDRVWERRWENKKHNRQEPVHYILCCRQQNIGDRTNE